MANPTVEELRMEKEDLELTLTESIQKVCDRFKEKTGVRISGIKIPFGLWEVGMGSSPPELRVDAVRIKLDL